MLIDTHCHIHEPYELPLDEVLQRASDAGVNEFICVGTSEESSKQAIAFAEKHRQAYAVIGVHPHDTKDGYGRIDALAGSSEKIVAVGEIGLDYFYTHSPREVQMEALEDQIKIALKHDLPIIFHVREAFDDFWPIFDKYPGIRGELHSFTDSSENLQKALDRGLYIGVNGISTFTKDETQKETFDSIPLDRLLFETDAPFLTPAPLRGKVNEPAYVKLVAQYHATRRGLSLEDIAAATTANARTLFRLTALS
ncbi:MAG: Preprotein translocase [Candidatus Saccharibacteria bacterium]|nr:Preprotein translocase [Candidatus Saccharibacteria bacterium]MDB5181000.1 Preprotein translocase [Candidatus Saccharibacteria bacterium]